MIMLQRCLNCPINHLIYPCPESLKFKFSTLPSSVRSKFQFQFSQITSRPLGGAVTMVYLPHSVFRMFPLSYGFGRDVLCVDYMVFTIRLIHIFAIHKQLGPKIIIVGKMVRNITP